MTPRVRFPHKSWTAEVRFLLDRVERKRFRVPRSSNFGSMV
jgi:hypothetical protein